MQKKDLYKTEQRWGNFKENYFKKNPKGTRKQDWNLLIEFLKDMELGVHTPKGNKGKRTAGTLLNLSSHNKLFLENFNKPLLKLNKKDLHKLEKEIEEGKILKRNGEKFTAFGNYIKDFKVFWNWLIRTGKIKEDITEDISAKTNKPSWVYMNEEKIKKFFNKLNFEYRVYCFFLYDSGARVSEALNLRIKDFSEDFSKVTIPDEISKTFGRTINLKLSTQFIKDFVKENNLEENDYLFQKQPFTINKYLRYHASSLFGKDKISHIKSRGTFGEFTMYDIRHNSCVFWFNRYPTHKGLMYRFGWRKPDKIEYYSEFLGVKDEISDMDMVTAEDRPKLLQLEEEMKKVKEDSKNYKKLIMKEVRNLLEDIAIPYEKAMDPKTRKGAIKVYDIVKEN